MKMYLGTMVAVKMEDGKSIVGKKIVIQDKLIKAKSEPIAKQLLLDAARSKSKTELDLESLEYVLTEIVTAPFC